MKNKTKTISGNRKPAKAAKKKTPLPKKSLLSQQKKTNINKTVLKDYAILKKRVTKQPNSKSAEKYRTILENIEDGYFEVDLAGNFTFFNDSVCRVMGYPREELMGMNNRQYIDKEELKKVFQTYNKVYKTGKPINQFGWQIIKKDGAKRYIEGSIFLQKDSSGKPKGFGGIVRDITERKKAEENLRDEEQKFRALAEQSSDIIILINREGIITYENPAINILGFKAEERIGAKVFELIHPDDLKIMTDSFNIFLRDKILPVNKTEIRIRHRDGSWRIFEIMASDLSRNNIIESVIVNLRDITERKKAESQRKAAIEALRKSETQLRATLEAAADGILAVDNNGKVVHVNRRFADLWRIPLSLLDRGNDRALLNFVLNQLTDPDAFLRKVQSLYDSDTEDMDNITFKDGRIFERYSLPMIMDGTRIGRVWSFRDITERKQVEEKLYHEEQRFRALAEQSSDIIILVNREGVITYENSAVEKSLGLNVEERIGASVFEHLYPDDLKVVTDAFNTLFKDKNAPVQQAEIRLCHRNGNWRTFEVVGSNLVHDNIIEAVIVNLRDITERKQAESQREALLEALRESEKRFWELSMIDDLSQLYNSRHFYAQLKKEIERSNRYGQPLTLLLMDLDKFKDFNDTYGHVEGDHVLSTLGQVIKRCLRETDSAYRYGGEEFTILLPMTTSDEGVATAKRIQTELSKEDFSPVSGQEVYLTVSIGLAQYKPKEDAKMFVHRVDQLMYKVKKNERGKICSDDGDLQ